MASAPLEQVNHYPPRKMFFTSKMDKWRRFSKNSNGEEIKYFRCAGCNSAYKKKSQRTFFCV
jgi:hypothetical protein